MTWIYPSNEDLWVENPFWNGLSEFYNETKPVRIESITTLEQFDPNNTTLFIIGPSTDFTNQETNTLREYVQRGGKLILLDDFGTANQLLRELETETRLSGLYLHDPLFREKNNLMPIVTVEGISNVDKIVLNIPTTIISTSNIEIHATSSRFSYTTTQLRDNPSQFNQNQIIVSEEIGEGILVLVSDSSIFINSMINKGQNRELLQYLSKGTIFIDVIHSSRSPLTYIQLALSSVSSVFQYFEIRYLVALIGILAFQRIDLRTDTIEIDEVQELLKKHPEYNEEKLRWLEAMRKKD